MPFPPLVVKAPPKRAGWRTPRYQPPLPAEMQPAQPRPAPSNRGGEDGVANDEHNNVRAAEPLPSIHPEHRQRHHRNQVLPPLPQQQYNLATAVTRLERHNAALVKENCALKTRLKKVETELAACTEVKVATADASMQTHAQPQTTSFRADAAKFRATGVLPPSIIETDVAAGRGAMGPKILATKDAKAELVELNAVEIPVYSRHYDPLKNHRTRAAHRVKQADKRVAAAGKILRSTEEHFNAIRPRAAAQIMAAVVAGTARYENAVEQADVAIEDALPPPAAQSADAAPASRSSSRDACSATLAELGNV